MNCIWILHLAIFGFGWYFLIKCAAALSDVINHISRMTVCTWVDNAKVMRKASTWDDCCNLSYVLFYIWGQHHSVERIWNGVFLCAYWWMWGFGRCDWDQYHRKKWSPHRCSWMLVSSVRTLFFNSILQFFYDGDQHLSDINLRGINISKTGCKIIDWTFNLTQNSPMAIYFCQTPPKITHKETRTNHEMKMH